MKLYREGDRSAGVCETCRSRVVTRMEYRDYTPPGWDVTVPGVLVAVCEKCGEVASVPHQSTPRINAHRRSKLDRPALKQIAARLPRELADALDLVTVQLGRTPSEITPLVVRFYISKVVGNPEVARAVRERAALPFAGPATDRFDLKISPAMHSKMTKFIKKAGINQTDLIRGIVRLASEDFQITHVDPARAEDKDSRRRRRFLMQLAKTV